MRTLWSIARKFFSANKWNFIFWILIILGVLILIKGLVIFGAIVALIGITTWIFRQLLKDRDTRKDSDRRLNDLELSYKSLKGEHDKILEENNYLRHRNFQITQIKSILELNLFEIGTSFTRSINNMENYNGFQIKYFGCLKISLKAKYGIDFKDLRFKYISEDDELLVANANPKFLSFANRKLEWEFFEMLEFRGQNSWADKTWMYSKTNNLLRYVDNVKENYRRSTEESLENGPEEFNVLLTPMKQKIESTIKLLFSSFCKRVTVVDHADDSFQQLDNIDFGAISVKKLSS